MKNRKTITFRMLFCEWVHYALVIFFFFDLVWVAIDFRDFSGSLIEPVELGTDLAYCGVFALISITVMLSLRRWLPRRPWLRRTAEALTVLANAIIAVVLEGVYNIVFPDVQDDFWGTAYLFCLISSLVSLTHSSRHYSNEALRQQKENEALRLQLLKRQLEPHFVFNSLTTLTALIETAPEQAEEYTIRLSAVYRYILKRIDRNLVPIGEALDFVGNYAALLEIHFPNLHVDVEQMDYNGREAIPSLSLQLLIENVVKHNRPEPSKPFLITIRRKGTYIMVANESSLPKSSDACIGMGLANLRQRCQILCNRDLVVTVTNNSFEVLVPIVKLLNEEKAT